MTSRPTLRMSGREEALQYNPFILPEDITLYKEQDRVSRERQREADAGKTLWERMDFSSVMADTRKRVDAIEPAFHPGDKKRMAAAMKQQMANAASGARDRRAERESLSDLVTKKRELLLSQLAMQLKTQEMERMKRALAEKEAALEKAEETLEEDAINFDTFFQENETAATLAIKRAEAASKAKQEKAIELKRMKNSIAAVLGDAAKLTESLDQFRQFSQYLDDLTPPEWFQAALDRQAAKRSAISQAQLASALEEWEGRLGAVEAQLGAKFGEERKACLRRGKPFTMPDTRAMALATLPPRPQLSDIPTPTLPEEDLLVPMFFREPAQLKALFEALEKSNLFLIQKFQDQEHALEELKAQQADTDEAMAAADAALAASVAHLEGRIREEEAKAAALREKSGGGSGGGGEGDGGGWGESAAAASGETDPTPAGGSGGSGGGGNILELIQPTVRSRVVDVYQQCGFKASASSDVISMLTAMEAKLDGLLERLTTLPPPYVAAKLKEKERERRGRVMAARKAKEAAQHQQRLSAMLERALVPPPKRTHRPIMYRSVVPKTEVVVVVEDASVVGERKRVEEEERFFS